MENNLYVSPSPHIHGGDSISKNMYGVLIALIPAFLVSLYVFGLGALIVTCVALTMPMFTPTMPSHAVPSRILPCAALAMPCQAQPCPAMSWGRHPLAMPAMPPAPCWQHSAGHSSCALHYLPILSFSILAEDELDEADIPGFDSAALVRARHGMAWPVQHKAWHLRRLWRDGHSRPTLCRCT